MEEPPVKEVVYQLIDENMFTRGVYKSLELACETARKLHLESGGDYQVNKIPLDTIGFYSETLDMVYSTAMV